MTTEESAREKLRQALLGGKKSPPGPEASIASSDQAPMVTGHVTITIIDQDGNEKIHFQDKNMVVTLAEEIMAEMSMGLKQISYVELGDPVAPSGPELTDTALEQTTGERKAITAVRTGNVVRFEALWGTGDGNGYSFTESGLFSSPFGSGQLFARKVFPSNPINKNAGFSFKITWALAFSVAEHNGGCTGVALTGGSTITADHIEVATGGETQFTLPFDFPVGANQLDVFMNGQRLVPGRQYIEAVIGVGKGINLVGFTANAGWVFYFVRRSLS